MREMKESGIEWIGEIPKDWEVCRFKNISTLYTGNSISDREKDDYLEISNSHPYISTKDIDVLFGNINYNSGLYTKVNDNKFKIAYEGSTLMCIEGGSAGRKKAYLKKNVSFVNKLCCFKPNNINRKYLYYFICSPNYEKYFKSFIGGLIGGVSVSVLKNIYVLIPDKIEQKNIVNFLDRKCKKVDEIIKKHNELIIKLLEYKKSIISEKVIKGLDPIVSMKDSGVVWIEKIPVHWDILKIKWLLKERKERSISGNEEPLSMSQKYGLIPTSNMKMIPNVASTYIGAKITYKKDMVFNKLKAHLGVFSVSKYIGLVSPDYAVYYTTGISDTKYLEYLFKTSKYINQFKKYSSGVAAGLTRLYTADLFSIKCAIPPISEQKEIANFLDQKCTKIDTTIKQKQSLITKLTEYKKSLIYEAVTGKIEITE